ncbi:MAG: sugar transferase [Bacteroidales bacterium]|nr:sugar transferase [Bacteroidales bacterium]
MKVARFRAITLAADVVLLTISFLIMAWIKPSGLKSYVPSHSLFFIILVVIWIIVSLINGKMHRGKIINFTSLVYRVFSSNIIALSITALLMYTFRDYEYSRTVVLGTALLTTFFELFAGAVFVAYKKASAHEYGDYSGSYRHRKPSEEELVRQTNGKNNCNGSAFVAGKELVDSIERECGSEMSDAVIKMAGDKLSGRTAVLSTTTIFNIRNLPCDRYDYIINLHRINDIKNINGFLEAINRKLEMNGAFLICVETKDQRKARILKKYPPVLNYIYYTFDFLIKRVLPKLRFTRPLYIFLTGGNSTVISRAEALGRICRAGFKIGQESFIGNLLCIESVKYRDPIPVNDNIYGPMIALPRVGKNGFIIKVYKLRTMHPYSEYIQDYVYNMHRLQNGGKFMNDFRVTSWGAVCRRVWLDELPMLINLFKGNMKLVGVRPLSRQYFDLYSKELRNRRIKYKPGLIPPFYADLPEDLDEIQSSELRYLDAYDHRPLLTDFRYFWKSTWNILFGNVRSN